MTLAKDKVPHLCDFARAYSLLIKSVNLISMSFKSHLKEIDEIVTKRLIRIPEEIKSKFPNILTEEDITWSIFLTDKYAFIFFLKSRSSTKITEIIKRNYGPFPGLITTNDEKKAAFNISGRYLYFLDCKVKNSHSFKVTSSATAIIQNLLQTIKIKELGTIENVIDLAYLIGFDDEINQDNYVEYLDDLVVYSVNFWRSQNGD